MTVGAASSDRPPPPAVAATRLSPGFRFHPTDEELVSYYLKRKVCGRSLRVDAVAEVDLYKHEPWDLPVLSRIQSRDLEWYFFSPLDRKYSNRSRTNRATAEGYWKTTGKDRPVRRGPRIVGMKKTLVFHAGRAPRGTRTNWVMHEYRLEDEELTQAGISQDAYVVCRIFQKNGAGPQNGAQYGAPFLEEEWEEEADMGPVLMPDGREDEFNEATEKEYLQFSDFLQNEDLENKHVNDSNFVADLDRKDCVSLPGDATILLDEVPFTNMVEFVNEPGQQINPTPIDDMEKKPLIEDFAHYHTRPNDKDEYVELDDLADSANVVYPFSEEYGFPIKACHAKNTHGAGGNSNLQKILDVEEFFDTMSQNSDHLESLQMSPVQENFFVQPNDLNPLAEGCPSSQQLQEKTVFYDAPSDNPSFRHENAPVNGLLYLPAYNPSGFEMVDDLLAYFDATDGSLHHDTMGFTGRPECIKSSDQSTFTGEVDGSNCPTSKATAQVLDIDTVGGASSSASSVAYKQSKGNYEEVAVRPDVQMSDANDKTVTKHLLNMLGSIPAPPACAAEFPSGSGKSVAQISGNHSASSIHVTAGFFHICGSTMSENAGYWSLQKNGHVDLILSYNSMADNLVRKTVGPGCIAKNQVDVVSVMLRVGLYVFFLSALILTISHKVGMSICGR
ncbi:NAC domain-containing protein 78-like isoform X1 [Musa acuminata AAA Group]|uniref:NAC domain-containing protein 78-like isoform X1 n=1 Tax=Musa acuminata AAA Group TaxID=214697 RepID=UPI0031E1A6A7